MEQESVITVNGQGDDDATQLQSCSTCQQTNDTNVAAHDCIETLQSLVQLQQTQMSHLEQELDRLSLLFVAREQHLLNQINKVFSLYIKAKEYFESPFNGEFNDEFNGEFNDESGVSFFL